MKLETFSYLPPMDENQVKAQINYILNNGWIPGIEFTNDPGPQNSYWSFWKLPLFNAKSVDEVWKEVNNCKREHPDSYIKITGYDNRRQGQVLSFVVHKPNELIS